MEISLEWLKNHSPDLEDINEETLETFTNMTGVPTQSIITKQNKTKILKDTIKWLQNNHENINDVPDKTIRKLKNSIKKKEKKLGKGNGNDMI